MDQAFNLSKYINHHIMDSYEWNLPFIKPIHLPEFLSLHGVMLIIASMFVFLLFGVLYNKKNVFQRESQISWKCLSYLFVMKLR